MRGSVQPGKWNVALIAASVLLAGAALAEAPENIDDLQRAFERPPGDARIIMRWWWFGSSVSKPQLEREMRLMKEGGIGGFEVQPVYPLALDDPARGIRNLPFLSSEFLDALRFTSDKARELGLRMDLTLGSGWPYGGPRVPISQAAGRLRFERAPLAAGVRHVPLPPLSGGEELIAAFATGPDGATHELTSIRDGTVWLSQTAKEVLFLVSSRTGMQVKRPALGAEGFVLDHYDRAAIDAYLATVGDPLLKALGSSRPYAIFCDSLEVFGSDWTADFLTEFRKRRGYDLRPHLPALVAGAGADTAALRHDWGKTLTELLEDRFLAPMQQWARRNGTLFRVQGYGIPPATVASNALADISEGEGTHWKEVTASRWAASASHVFGRPVASSETWTWLHSPVFRASPLDVKAEADLHFLQGITQLIGHGWPYTPENVEYPGWRFYAAGVFNHRNPWWIVMPDLALYLQRISFLLRQGQPVNDVAFYLPTSDAYASITPGRAHLLDLLRQRLGPEALRGVLEAGYNLDLFDDGVLERVGRVEKSALVLGQNRYRAVILPEVERIPLRTLERLEEFARAGGILIATGRTPSMAPGFAATDSEQQRIRQIAAALFQGTAAVAHLAADAHGDLGRKLNALLPSDVELDPAASEIGFVHRTTPFAEIYFLANTGSGRYRGSATLRIDGLNPEWWDPLLGTASPARVSGRTPGKTTVVLELEPYGSRVLIFSKRTPRDQVRELRAGSSLDLSTGWRVRFGSQEKEIAMDALTSWTELDETRFFSGTAVYEKEASVPEQFLLKGVTARLDFGEGAPVVPARLTNGMRAWFDPPVREAAIVYVNDRRAGALWCPPYQLDITGHLKPGVNRIRVTVANLALNHMAGRRLPDYKLLNLRYGVRFDPQDMDKVAPVPAGLMGPIRLTAYALENR